MVVFGYNGIDIMEDNLLDIISKYPGWRFTNVRKIKIIVRSNVSPKLRFTKVHLSCERLKSVRKFRATSGLL